MKRIINFIVKHSDGIAMLGLLSLFIVADAEPREILGWIPVPMTLFAVSAIGARIRDKRESEEL